MRNYLCVSYMSYTSRSSFWPWSVIELAVAFRRLKFHTLSGMTSTNGKVLAENKKMIYSIFELSNYGILTSKVLYLYDGNNIRTKLNIMNLRNLGPGWPSTPRLLGWIFKPEALICFDLPRNLMAGFYRRDRRVFTCGHVWFIIIELSTARSLASGICM